MTFSAKSVSGCIDPASVAGKDAELVDEQDESALTEACRLHRFCLEEITYKRYEELRPAKDVLETGEGDCTDQTALLSSLLLCREIPVRVVHVQDHMFPEALLPVEPGSRVDREVRQLYDLRKDTEIRSLGEPSSNEVEASGYWYPVDSEMSRYLGDLQVHAEENLLVQEDGEWQWEDVQLCKVHSPSEPKPEITA